MSPLLGAVAAALALLLSSVVVMYNRFVRQRTLVDEAWGGTAVELTRRHDLIPNLVSTVRGYATHERELLESLVAAREAAAAHDGDTGFLALQDELAHTEARIAASRRFYNGNVRAYNTRIRTFPWNLVASAIVGSPRGTSSSCATPRSPRCRTAPPAVRPAARRPGGPRRPSGS